MKKYLVIAALLAGCGGSDKPPTYPPTPSLPQEPVEPPKPLYKAVWTEDWSAVVFDGVFSPGILQCAGSPADPELPPGRIVQPPEATWVRFGNADGAVPQYGYLMIDSWLKPAYAVLSWQTFDHTKPLRLSGTVDLTPDPGTWLGLTLLHSENDYREIVIREDNGKLFAFLYAPCYLQRLVEVPLGERKLEIEYDPKKGWDYIVDDVVIFSEPLDYNGARLTGDVRVGIYVVSQWKGDYLSKCDPDDPFVIGPGPVICPPVPELVPGRVKARIGPLTVSTKE